MPLTKYQPDAEVWKQHFKQVPSDVTFHPLKKSQGPKGPPSPIQVNLVTPVQQAVEQAKAKLKSEKKKKIKKNPWDRV